MDGFLNILKPPGMTSHDVVSFLRKNFNIKKVGHLGTLDPGAAGVLPLCIGKATKLAQFVMTQTKTYRAEITFGFSTDSIDKFGNITSVMPVKILEQHKISEIESVFKGNVLQIPPIYSAKKVDGKKLYQYAREGKTIDIKPSFVTIYDINVISYEAPYKIMFDVKCSKGTYVRALVRDICDYLNISGYMSMLIRSSVGSFTLENSFTLEEVVSGKYKIMKIDDIITFPGVCLGNDDYRKIVHGNPVKNKYIDANDELIKLYSPEHFFVGVGKVVGDRIYVERLLFGADG